MEVTEVRIKLMDDAGERLQAFCSITLDDCFVIRDLKIIERSTGPFVAMPSRKLTAHCGQCGCKNYLRAAFCNQCGGRLSQDRAGKDEEGRAKLYADIAHPINAACRELIQHRVIEEFRAELERVKLPGYVSRYDDFDHDEGPSDPPASAKTLRYDQPEKAVQRPANSPAPPAKPAVANPSPVKLAPSANSSSAKQAIVQTAEKSTRPPHHGIKPVNAAERESARNPSADRDDFGAGIF